VSPDDLVQQADNAATQGAADVAAAPTLDDLARVERTLLGKGSALVSVREAIKTLPGEERARVGKAVSSARTSLEDAIEQRRAALEAAARSTGYERERIDLTVGGREYERGHLHLVTQVWRELEDIFTGLGYRVFYGPEVEDDWHNFEALNFPPGHPARAMQDTLYVKLGRPEETLLRTHTSPMQIRLMEKYPPPIYSVVLGRTYRRDTMDARHSPVFHQIEALVVDRGITMGDLMGTIELFFRALFGPDVEARFLPSYFPFTEPSAELATSCPFCHKRGCRVCSQTGWIELGGCGMVDPNVFRAVGIDPEEYSGFAFGFGIDRIPLLRNRIGDIKALLWDNDIRLLRQF
jgi:phenylalanyl-tRNA synthetase alpha chain